MRLGWIEVRDFRNHEAASLQVGPGLTAVVGPNGRGKTNLLEAIYYLCWLVSPRVSNDLPDPIRGDLGLRAGRGRERDGTIPDRGRGEGGRPEPGTGEPVRCAPEARPPARRPRGVQRARRPLGRAGRSVGAPAIHGRGRDDVVAGEGWSGRRL
ncbi:MAG: hypothetical protein E6G40_00010 [Actinobacteria bacterium]|nr:MAG: hypothetical protein E6G40_00010 [Actinomycetota bacterium]